jgi:hypothetical protein
MVSRETREAAEARSGLLKANYLGYLSFTSHILFWFFVGWCEVATGEAGSPLPDNWESLLLQSKISSSVAVLCLVISVGCGVSMVAGKRTPPVSSVTSLLLLGPASYFCWSMVTTNVF